MLDAIPCPERWGPVPGYEGLYEVSNLGRVRSFYVLGCRGEVGPRSHLLKPAPATKTCYPTVVLCADDTQKTWRLHILVMLTFAGPCPEGLVVRHLDGNPENNRWAPGDEAETRAAGGNLIYGTDSENMFDTVDHGMHWQARKTRCKYGHEFTPESTDINAKGHRRCRICMRKWRQEYKDRKRAA